ncbi:hypothetical protein SEA_YARA_64 [Streptomyces phage Yara]|nr:hypothetical protein SEA_YARA_64 [Streptomyces phage Yara]
MAKTEEDGPQFAHLVDKEPTDLHKRFAAWLVENTGLDEDEIDLKSVQLACSLRIEFQRSPENQANLEARREAAEKAVEARALKAQERAEKREQAERDKAAKAAAAKAKKEAEKEAKANAPEADEDAPAKPSRRRRGAAAPAAPAEEEAPKPTTRRRRGKPAPAPVVESEDEFDEDDDL